MSSLVAQLRIKTGRRQRDRQTIRSGVRGRGSSRETSATSRIVTQTSTGATVRTTCLSHLTLRVSLSLLTKMGVEMEDRHHLMTVQISINPSVL